MLLSDSEGDLILMRGKKKKGLSADNIPGILKQTFQYVNKGKSFTLCHCFSLSFIPPPEVSEVHLAIEITWATNKCT